MTAQKDCFFAAQGNVLAMGGPGAGKTHAALVKAHQIITAGGLRPGQKVVFLSFARPTVARVLEKAVELVGRDALSFLEISTYHSFAWNILRSHAYLLNGKRVVELIPPPQAAALLAPLERGLHEAEKRRLFDEDGRLHFDLFAGTLARLFERVPALRAIYADSYPVIILDEFQDTNTDEWAMVQQLGASSRLIALADPEQRIYEFRGADPARLQSFIDQFNPEICDFTGENHRSRGTDIATFGNDLLTGANRNRNYVNVTIATHGFRRNQGMHFALKAQTLQALRRLRQQPNASLAILVPSRALMIQVSDYLSTAVDGLPALSHDVAMDTAPPALAAAAIATLFEHGSLNAKRDRLIEAVEAHILGKRGTRDVPAADVTFANALKTFRVSGRVTGTRRQRTVNECARLADKCTQLPFTGDPAADWGLVRDLFQGATCDHLQAIAVDAKYLRLLHRGAALRTSLGELWRQQGSYDGAVGAVSDALVQEHFSTALKDPRGIHLMTIHKSKGKEFNEVIIYDGAFHRLLKDPTDERRVAQERLALRVAVTRAIQRATILTPENSRCAFL